MRRPSRSRIHASSTGSPSIAMELATWRGIASRWRRRRSSGGRLRQRSMAFIQPVSGIVVLPFLQQCIRNAPPRCTLVGGAQQSFQPGQRKRPQTLEQIQHTLCPAPAGSGAQARSRRREIERGGGELVNPAIGGGQWQRRENIAFPYAANTRQAILRLLIGGACVPSHPPSAPARPERGTSDPIRSRSDSPRYRSGPAPSVRDRCRGA